MVEERKTKKLKRSYPKFWDKFIPVAVFIILAIILFLAYITARVALGLPAL